MGRAWSEEKSCYYLLVDYLSFEQDLSSVLSFRGVDELTAFGAPRTSFVRQGGEAQF